MKKLYISGNYIIADFGNGTLSEYPTGGSAYTLDNSVYMIKEDIDDGELLIPIASIPDWFDEAGVVPFSEATLVTFLRENTGNFSRVSASGAQISDVATWDGSNYIPLPAAGGANTSLMAFVGFVNPNVGSDITGVVGDANLPFQSVLEASVHSNYIYLTPGNYTETITLKSGVVYYSPFGVKFTSGGLRCTTLISKTKWLGHADFDGNLFAIYLNGGEYRDCVIEFNRIKTTGGSSRSIFISATGTTTSIDIKGVSVDAYGANAHGVRFQGTISGTCTISEFVTCFYSTLVFGFSGIPLIGKFVFNCPKIILKNGGFGGNLAQYKHCIYFIDSDPNTDVTVNGNCYSEMVATQGSTSGAISTLSGAVAGGVLKLNGNIYSQSLKAVRNIFAMTMIINGDINSDAQAFILSTSSITIVKNSTITHFVTNNIAATAQLFLNNSSLYCNQLNANIFTHASLTAILEMNNVQAQGEGVAEFINTNGIATTAGLLNCSSNFVNDVALINSLSTPLNVEANINVPKFN